MRGRVIIKGAIIAAGLTVGGAAATALSTLAATPYDQTLTLAGGETAVDPDAPIRTARYGDAPRGTATAPSAIELAGAPSSMPLAGDASSVAPSKPVVLAAEDSIPSRDRFATVRPRQDGPRPSYRAQTLTLASFRPSFSYAAVARLDAPESQPFLPQSQQSAIKRLSLNASALMGKAQTSAQDAGRGRWMLFAASSGKALGLNLIRDSLGGWRGAGWSQERLARYGTHQLGIGWRKDNKQISLSATSRKLSVKDFRTKDFSEKDVVYGVSLSIKPR
ncbi:MAG: hypothetical protein KKC14_12810 [Alphaproteobacteria bacterium]|nr:hypothetical protein [Alphaproteobacteria bacterium]